MILKVNIIKNLPAFLLLLLVSPLFFYKLGQSSLTSWDEAWYGEISKNILRTGDLLNLVYNGLPFSDKPPAGFWIEALSFRLFGLTEFAARLPQVVAGLVCLYIVYLLGAKFFGKLIGLVSLVALCSSFWFLFRARSGNLDVLLTCFYLLTFYLAYLASQKKKLLLPFSLSFGLLSVIKGIVFLAALFPPLLIIFWGNKLYKPRDYLLPAVCVLIFFGTWIFAQYLNSVDLAMYHFNHSLRDSSIQSNILDNIKLLKEYLHNGIGRWFWPGIGGVALGVILRNRGLLALATFVIFYSLQFVFSPQVGIWHLIPLYPFMILSFFGSIYVLWQKIMKEKLFISILLVAVTIFVSVPQMKQMWYGFIDVPAYISDEAILSKLAGNYSEKFYIYDAFESTAAFYSGKRVKWVGEYDMPGLFQKESFVLITRQDLLDKFKVDKASYKIIQTDRDKILILYKPIAF